MNNYDNEQATQKNENKVSLLYQILFIGFSALPFWIGIYWLLPKMVQGGISRPIAFSVSVFLPLIILFIAAVVLGLRESKIGYKGLFEAWHLKPMKKSDWGWTLALFGVMVGSYLALGSVTNWIATQFPSLAPPYYFSQLSTNTSFMGITMKGNWLVLVIHLTLLFFNIFGEELLFRGILFSKQEKKYGKRGWLVHALSYHVWHMFYPWDVIRLLPASLGYAWVRQRTGNTWTTIIAHFMFNGIGLIMTIGGILQ